LILEESHFLTDLMALANLVGGLNTAFSINRDCRSLLTPDLTKRQFARDDVESYPSGRISTSSLPARNTSLYP